MAYLNSETFEIMCSDGIDRPPNGWFYTDDRLAETIQALNLRGYKTSGCRIDPAFDRYSQITLINVRDSEGKTPSAAGIARAYEMKVSGVRVTGIRQIGKQKYRLTVRTNAPKQIQIAFSQNVPFQKIPDGCEYNEGSLVYSFSGEICGIEYLNACQDCIQNLYNWVCSLPVGLW